MWHHQNNSNLATSEKQSDGGQVQFLHIMAFHSNCSRWCDFGPHWLQRDGPVPYQSVFSNKSLFWQPAPKLNSPLLATSTWWKSPLFSAFIKNHSDRAHRVVHSSPCCMFHASLCTIQSKKFCSESVTCCAWRCRHHASGYHHFSSG